MANLVVSGDTSGSVTLSAPAVAGSPVVTLPNTTGTLALTTDIPTVSGSLIRAPQILTSGTSYTTPSNCTAIYVEAVGAGGGADNRVSRAGGGGGGGAYCAKYFTVTGNTAYTYAIGAGSAGLVGGNTTFTVGATTITAGGGQVGTQYNYSAPGVARPAAGGTATNGDLNVVGSPSTGAFSVGASSSTALPGNGGGSMFGGGSPASTNTALTTGAGFGGGAGGSVDTDTDVAGGNGVIRIWEFT